MTRDRILVVDDDRSMRASLSTDLAAAGYDVVEARDAEEALRAVDERHPDAVVTDLRMPGMSGLDLTRAVAARSGAPPVIVITGFGTIEGAVEAMRVGAFDFVAKPFDSDVLLHALARALETRHLREEVSRLRTRLEGDGGGMFGESPAMQEVRDLVERVARLDVSVLITGETGVGKEIVARALHERSPRRGAPFVAVNTTALPETLLESELFGHEKGAFTDAQRSRQGLFVEASGGTLFLDEIGHMPMPMQPKLLRALQDRTVRPLGGNKEVPFDARVVSATSVELEHACQDGRFREDLFYRLNVVHIRMPPLRERGADVLALAEHFCARFAERMGRQVSGFDRAAAHKLLAYPWPGNVRELQNAVERAVALARDDVVMVDDLPPRVRDHKPTRLVLGGDATTELVSLAEMERRYVLHVLRAVGDNRSRAAEVLGIDRKTLYRNLKLWGEDAEKPKSP